MDGFSPIALLRNVPQGTFSWPAANSPCRHLANTSHKAKCEVSVRCVLNEARAGAVGEKASIFGGRFVIACLNSIYLTTFSLISQLSILQTIKPYVKIAETENRTNKYHERKEYSHR